MLVLLALAILRFWPEYQPLPAERPTYADDSPGLLLLLRSQPAVEAERLAVPATAASSLSAVQSCPAPKPLAEQLATLLASRQHQSEELKHLMQEAQLRPVARQIQDPELMPALQKAGYRIPVKPTAAKS